MQIGEFRLQQQVVMGVAADVAGAARPGAAGLHGFHHGGHNIRVLAHAEVIIAAPDRHILHFAVAVASGLRKQAPAAFQIGKDSVVAFGLEGVELG